MNARISPVLARVLFLLAILFLVLATLLMAGCAYKSNVYSTKITSERALGSDGRAINIEWQDSDARVDAVTEFRAKAEMPPATVEAAPAP